MSRGSSCSSSSSFCVSPAFKSSATQVRICWPSSSLEKLFSADKSFLGGQSMRVQSSEAVSTKFFIEFIALIVRNRIYNLLKETMQKLDGNPSYLTVPAALRELEKIEMTRQLDKVYRLDHAVTKTQKVILSAFGMDWNHVKYRAENISKILKGVQ